MRPRILAVILAVGILSLLAGAAEIIGAPQAVRVVLGVPLVLIFPGFAAVYAVIPGRELSIAERATAILGMSLAISICISVLLAATPIGLSKGSAAATLGVGTAALSLYARARAQSFLMAAGNPRKAERF
jgi:uncharacterized membrane protein